MTSLDAGTARARYDLDISGLRRGVQEAKTLYRSLKQEAQAAAAAARGGGAGRGSNEAAELRRLQREAREALRETEKLERQLRRTADAEIAAARATGDYTRALALVDRELGAASNDLARYNQLLARQAQIQKQATPRVAPVAPTPAAAPSLGNRIVQGAGAVGIAFGAAEIAQTGVELAQLGRRVTIVTTRFNELAQQGGSTGESLLRALRAASGGEIDDLNLRLTANRAAIQGVGDSAEELAPLLAIARDRAEALGLDTTQAFNDLVEGLAKAQPEILDNLGITLNLTQVYAAYSKELGKTAAELTVAEKRAALLNAVLEQAGNVKAIDPNPYRQLGTEIENLRQQLGQMVDQELLPAAEAATLLVRALNGRGDAGLGDMSVALTEVASVFNPVLQAIADYNTFILRTIGLHDLLIGGLNDLGRFFGVTRTEADAATDATQQATVATMQQEQAVEGATDAIAQAQQATIDAIRASQEKALADREQTAMQDAIAEAAVRVATGQSTQAAETARLIALYPALAGEADVLITQQLRLAAATDEVTLANARRAGQERLAAQQQATRDQSGGLGYNSPGRTGTSDVDAVVRAIEAERQAQIQAQEDLVLARQRAVAAFETTAERVARLRQAEADALARNGRESAAYIDAQVARRQAEAELAEENARAQAKRERSGASAARSQDRQLAQIENRQAQHAARLLQIQEDYQRDAMRSQEDFERGRSRDQEDFARDRQRLLAEGKIFEARQLAEAFARQQQRDQEDFAIQRSRRAEDAANRMQQETGTEGTPVVNRTNTPGATTDAAAVLAPLPSAGGGGGGTLMLQVQIAPTSVQIDGQQIVTLTWPTIARLVDSSLAEQVRSVQVAAPPQPDGSPVAGPRP